MGNIEIQFDPEITKEFYSSMHGFACDCPDCLNYVDKLPVVKSLLNGLDDRLGFDISKDVGQGMDELMPHDNYDHSLYVIPYYVCGRCRLKDKELSKEPNGPIWNSTTRVGYGLAPNLRLTIINTTDSIEMDNAESVITIWLEFKTEPPIKH